MKTTALLISLLCGLLAGCAMPAPPAKAKGVTVYKNDNDKARVLSAYFTDVDGHLAMNGSIKKPRRWTLPSPVHLDVRFYDASGTEIALKIVKLRLPPASRRINPLVSFSVDSEPWPEGTARVVVSVHSGRTHS
jgi:hypothetical protein